MGKISIPQTGAFEAFAVMVDINGYTCMVKRDESGGIAHFIVDTLDSFITIIQKYGGEVVSIMGDAILGILPHGNDAFCMCVEIAKKIDDICEHISNAQTDCPDIWSHTPGGPSIKIGIEYGRLDVAIIRSNFLGDQRLLAGNAINYARRIMDAGDGNRCHLGPIAAGMPDFSPYLHSEDPAMINGKPGEGMYEYHELDLGEYWREGPRQEGEDSYWG